MKSKLLSKMIVFGMMIAAWAMPGAANAQQNEQDVKVIVTSDNGYSFAFGKEDGIEDGNLEGDIWNSLASDIYLAEEYTVTKADEDTYLYIIAWSDDSVYQGTIANFELLRDGDIIATGEDGWEVFATGIDYSSSTGPALASINEQIAIANQALGDSATTSVTWVDMDGDPNGVGALVGFDHNAITSTYPAMPAGAQWIWYDPDTTDSITADGRNPGNGYFREYLIFRIGLGATFNPLAVDVQSDCTETGGSFVVSVRSDGAVIDRVWYELNGVEVDLCNGNCGADYEGSFSLTGEGGSFEVFATSSEADVYDDSDTVEWACDIEPTYECIHGATLVDVRNGSVVNADISAGSFSAQAEQTPTRMVGDVTSTGSVFMGNASEITGTLTLPSANDLDAQSGSIINNITYATVTLADIPERAFSYGGDDYTLAVDSSAVLQPGDRGAVEIGARSSLTLVSGKYGFESLHIDTDTTVTLDVSSGPIEINVEGDVEIKSRVSVTANVTDGASLVSWYTNGDFTVYDGLVFTGSVIAPFGDIAIYSRNVVNGCLAGDVVVVDNDNDVQAYWFTGWPAGSCGDGVVDSGEECDDGNSVSDDGCTNSCEIDTCNDGVLNGDESDVDCGGSCGGCEEGDVCNSDSDCLSDVCTGGYCAAAVGCTEATAVDLGASFGGITVATDGCVKIPGPLDSWVASIVLQAYSGGSFPVPFAWENCGNTGTGEITTNWDQDTFAVDDTCTTVIDLQGASGETMGLKWWPVG